MQFHLQSEYKSLTGRAVPVPARRKERLKLDKQIQVRDSIHVSTGIARSSIIIIASNAHFPTKPGLGQGANQGAGKGRKNC